MNFSKPLSSKVLTTYRSTKTLDATKLQSDINDALSKIDSLFKPSLDHLMSLYNRDLKDIQDTAAPIQSRWIRHFLKHHGIIKIYDKSNVKNVDWSASSKNLVLQLINNNLNQNVLNIIP